MRKIAVISKYWYPEAGGAELATYLIAKRFLSRIFDEVIIVSGTSPTRAEIPPNTKYYHLKYLKGNKLIIAARTFLRNSRLLNLLKNVDTVYITSNALLHVSMVLRRKGYNNRIIIHLHDYQPIVYTAALIHGLEPGALNDYYVERLDYRSRIRAIASFILHKTTILYKEGLSYSDAIIVVSHRQKEILAKGLGRSLARKMIVVYNPLPERKLSSRIKKIRDVIYLGGSKATKGLHILLRSIKVLKEQGLLPSVTLTNLRSSDIQYILELRQRKQLALTPLPRVPREKLLKLQASHRVIAIPSISEEPLPYVVVEAALAGALPVATRVGGVPELVRGTIAEKLLVTPGDHLGLAKSILYALQLNNRVLEEEVRALRGRMEDIMSDYNIYYKISEVFGSK